jgi:hypothetical protein
MVALMMLAGEKVDGSRKQQPARATRAKPSHAPSQGQQTLKSIPFPTTTTTNCQFHRASIDRSDTFLPTPTYTQHISAHHASGYAAHRRLRARPIQAQPARPRFPSRDLPPHGRRRLHLRFLARGSGYPRTKVCLLLLQHTFRPLHTSETLAMELSTNTLLSQTANSLAKRCGRAST